MEKLNNKYVEFGCMGDLEDYCRTSLLFYSDEEFAYLRVGNIYLSLMVRGEVTIDYKEDRYKNYGQYSQEFKDILRSDRDWYIDDDIWVIDNNWFNLEFYKVNETENGKQLELIFDDCDSADYDLKKIAEEKGISLSGALYQSMIETLKDYLDYLKEIAETDNDEDLKKTLENLDLKNI
jgi:hypothetical protein